MKKSGPKYGARAYRAALAIVQTLLGNGEKGRGDDSGELEGKARQKRGVGAKGRTRKKNPLWPGNELNTSVRKGDRIQKPPG